MEYLHLPKVSAEYLWADNWYDGPLEGLCEYQGKKYWFCLVDEEEGTHIWRYTLHELPPEQLTETEKWHALFRKKVGTHFDRCENGKCGVTHPKELHKEFFEPYEAREPKYKYSDNPAVFWTDDL